VSVFAWGLKYKLSLYDPPQSISHSMPAAKLLSDNERPQALTAVLQNPTDASFPSDNGLIESIYTPIILISGLGFAPGMIAAGCAHQRRIRRSPDIGLPVFFFRPPPALS
jgi:hypothetical protein